MVEKIGSDAIGGGRALKPDRSSRPVRFKPLPGAEKKNSLTPGPSPRGRGEKIGVAAGLPSPLGRGAGGEGGLSHYRFSIGTNFRCAAPIYNCRGRAILKLGSSIISDH